MPCKYTPLKRGTKLPGGVVYSQETRMRVIHALASGKTQATVARQTGIGAPRICTWWDEYNRDPHAFETKKPRYHAKGTCPLNDYEREAIITAWKLRLMPTAKAVHEELVASGIIGDVTSRPPTYHAVSRVIRIYKQRGGTRDPPHPPCTTIRALGRYWKLNYPETDNA